MLLKDDNWRNKFPPLTSSNQGLHFLCMLLHVGMQQHVSEMCRTCLHLFQKHPIFV